MIKLEVKNGPCRMERVKLQRLGRWGDILGNQENGCWGEERGISHFRFQIILFARSGESRDFAKI